MPADPDPAEVAIVRAVGLHTNEIVTCFMLGDDQSCHLAGELSRLMVANGEGPLGIQFLAVSFANVMKHLARRNDDDPLAVWRRWCEDDARRADGTDTQEDPPT
jgi:hypothetical protein